MKIGGSRAALLLGACLLVSAPALSEVCSTTPDVPGFRIETRGKKYSFRPDHVPFTASGPGFRATLTQEGDAFSLLVESLGYRVTRVDFPRMRGVDAAAGSRAGNRFLLPRALGIAVPVSAIKPNQTQGCDYPGKCFSPLLVREFPGGAELIAALDWPPLRRDVVATSVDYGLVDHEVILPLRERRYRALVVERCGPGAWQSALSIYRAWLGAVMRATGLLPANQSEALKRSNGWWSVHLQNMPRFDPDYLASGWELALRHFPWVQFWGQMSTYAGDPELAVPKPEPGESIGCCLNRIRLHDRYRDALSAFLREVGREGRAGLYAKASGQLFRPDGGESGALALLREWLDANRRRGANAVYIDVLGNAYFGEVFRVARLFADPAFRDAVIEFPVDVYPAAYLASGSLQNPDWASERDAAPGAIHSFPRLGRTVLWDRIILLGRQNGDGELFLHTKDYWGLRQAFLLGAKLDMTHLTDGSTTPPGGLAQVLDELVGEWDGSDWWAREPVYLDEQGLVVLDGIQARRFRGSAGEHLLVAVNWEERPGLGVYVDDEYVPVPERRFSIQVLPE